MTSMQVAQGGLAHLYIIATAIIPARSRSTPKRAILLLHERQSPKPCDFAAGIVAGCLL
jgi:hypothetical protein